MKAWLKMAARLAPVVLRGIAGVPAGLIPDIVVAVLEAEQTGKPGPEKKQQVLAALPGDVEVPLVASAVDTIVSAVNEAVRDSDDAVGDVTLDQVIRRASQGHGHR